MATIKDIAKALNIGVSTVSMALNNHPKISEETKKMVNAKALELRYQRNGIAIDLQRRSTNIILLVVEDASRPFFAEVIGYIQEEIARYDYNLIISTTFKEHSQTARKFISEHRVDGVIVFTDQITDEFIKLYASPDFPIFLLGRYLNFPNVYSFYSSSLRRDGYDITNHLIKMGHKRIAFVKSIAHGLGASRRLLGYKECLKDNNIQFNENYIFSIEGNNFSSGYMITHNNIIPKINDIDAVFYSNDEMAIGALSAFKDSKIDVPDQISIVGYSNIRMSYLINPTLTTMEMGIDIQSKVAVNILIDALLIQDDKTIKEKYDLELKASCTFICERETVKERS